MQIQKPVVDYLLEILEALEPKLGTSHVFSHKSKSNPEHHKSLGKLKEQLTSSSSAKIQTDVIQRILEAYLKLQYRNQVTLRKGARINNIDPWLQIIKTGKAEGTSDIAFDSIIHADGAHGTSRQALTLPPRNSD